MFKKFAAAVSAFAFIFGVLLLFPPADVYAYGYSSEISVSEVNDKYGIPFALRLDWDGSASGWVTRTKYKNGVIESKDLQYIENSGHFYDLELEKDFVKDSNITYEYIIEGIGSVNYSGLGFDPAYGSDYEESVKVVLEFSDSDSIYLKNNRKISLTDLGIGAIPQYVDGDTFMLPLKQILADTGNKVSDSSTSKKTNIFYANLFVNGKNVTVSTAPAGSQNVTVSNTEKVSLDDAFKLVNGTLMAPSEFFDLDDIGFEVIIDNKYYTATLMYDISK